MSGRHRASRATSSYPRTARVNQVLREVIADELERLADVDERLRLVTVTGVDTAPDLAHATVWFSSLSAEVAAALSTGRVQLQRAIGRQVRLKRTPHLVFAADPGVAAGQRVDDILRQLHGSGGSGADPGADQDHGSAPRR